MTKGSDNEDIYVKLVDGGTPQRLTTNPAAEVSPTWSPDGHYIAFTRISERERTILTIPAIGGPEHSLLTAKVASVLGSGGAIDWSPDGKSLVYADASAPQRPFGLYRLSVETLETQRLTSPPEHWIGDQQPVFSPDGQTLAFVRMSSEFLDDIYVTRAAGGEPRRITFDKQPIHGLAWMPDGRSIAFSSSRGGAYILWRISLAGGEPEPLGVGGDSTGSPAFSRQGKRLAYSNHSRTMSISRVDLSDSPGKTGAQMKMLSTMTDEYFPQISPDGKRIVFGSARSGMAEIWVCDSDGSNLLKLTQVGRPVSGAPRWSPDGRYIAFDSRPDEQSDIFVIGANGGTPRRLTESPANDEVPSWSRDGRWIYFASNRTGTFQVWKMPVQGGDAVQVTKQGGFLAFESPDGKYVYYGKGRELPGLWRVPVNGGDEEPVLDWLSQAGWGLWAVVDRGIYFAEQEGKSGGVIKFFSFATRRMTRVATMDRPPEPDLAVSPDGRWLLYTQVDSDRWDIMLVENYG